MNWSEHAWAAWLALAALLGIAEMFSLDLVLIMLAAGAMAGFVLAVAGAPELAQAIAAAAVATATLALARPRLLARLDVGPDLRLGHSKLVGTQGLVTQQITGHTTGRIKIGGEIWSAAPYDDTLVIAPGETVEVFEIRGATAYVHPVPQLDS